MSPESAPESAPGIRPGIRGCGYKEIAVALRDFCYRPRKLFQFLGIMKL